MKNKFWMFLLALTAFLGFNLSVKAETVVQSVKLGPITKLPEYVTGVIAYVKNDANTGKSLYCEDASLQYPTNLTLNLNSAIDKGYIYILKNQPSTGNSSLNAYIMQVSIWWYKDTITGTNNNISQTAKNYIINNRNTDTACYYIYNLVTNAKNYNESNGSLDFSNNTVNFTQSGNYYYSDYISVSSSNLSSLNTIEFVNAPYGTQIVNNTISSTTHSGTFRISIPVSSISQGTTWNFNIKTTGKYTINSAYNYYYSSGYQKLILDKIYPVNNSINISKSLNITSNAQNQVLISKVDIYGNYVTNAILKLYSGNCVSTNCLYSNLHTTWLTLNEAMSFTGLPAGYYTLEESTTPAGYQTAEKMLLYINSNTGIFRFTMVDQFIENNKFPVQLSKVNIAGVELPGASLIVKDVHGFKIENWVSTSSPKYLWLDPGVYTLNETNAPDGYLLNTTTITFKVDSYGRIYQKNSNGNYTQIDEIKMVNKPVVDEKESVNISKLDIDTNEFVSGASLVIKNSSNEVITSWTSGKETFYTSILPGEYTLSETAAPTGYVINNDIIYFKINSDGIIMVKNSSGTYETVNGIIMYNSQKPEEIVVPKTSLSSASYYISGISLVTIGGWLLIKNGKKA